MCKDSNHPSRSNHVIILISIIKNQKVYNSVYLHCKTRKADKRKNKISQCFAIVFLSENQIEEDRKKLEHAIKI